MSHSDHFSPEIATAAAAMTAAPAKTNRTLFSFHPKLFIFRENIGMLLTRSQESRSEASGQNHRVYSNGKKCGLKTV